MIRQYLSHAQLRRPEPLACGAQPLDTLLEQPQRFVEVELFALESLDDQLEPLEVLGKPTVLLWHSAAPNAGRDLAIVNAKPEPQPGGELRYASQHLPVGIACHGVPALQYPER